MITDHQVMKDFCERTVRRLLVDPSMNVRVMVVGDCFLNVTTGQKWLLFLENMRETR